MESTPIYRTAEELGISEETRQGLVQLARDLADGTVPPERFDMAHACGTACCIAGHLDARGVRRGVPLPDSPEWHLYLPWGWQNEQFAPAQGSVAIVNFLMGADDPWAGVA